MGYGGFSSMVVLLGLVLVVMCVVETIGDFVFICFFLHFFLLYVIFFFLLL